MDELQASLDTYQGQLSQVLDALRADPSNADFLQLKQDLDQVIQITTQSLLEEKKKQLLEQLDQAEATRQTPESSDIGESLPKEAAKENEAEKEDDLQKLVGMKCRAPHRTKGSGTASMNSGIIYEVESEATTEGGVSVRVVFSHPLSADMAPCPFFLEARCRFEDGDCRFSHGEVVGLKELEEFREPDFSSVREGSHVLAKKTVRDGERVTLWAPATVIEVREGVVCVRFSHGGAETAELEMESVFPVAEEGEGGEEDEEDSGRRLMDTCGEETVLAPGEDVDKEEFAPVQMLGELETSALGEWEQHTKGFASRVMAKMGYVSGSGLGRSGEGRVLPVPAMVYPVGRSLDWCMEAREKAGGGDVLSVEKRMRREREREERKSRRRAEAAEERDRRENSLFSFINSRVLSGVQGGSSSSSSGGGRRAAKRPTNKGNPGENNDSSSSDSGKKNSSLNVKSFHVAEEIRKVEKDVERLKASHARHTGKDAAAAAAIAAKLGERRKRLAGLRDKERRISTAKSMEEGNKKLSIF